MSNQTTWKATFQNWPAGIPKRGVMVNNLNEANPFKSYMLKDDLLLLERTNPDPLGSRYILMTFDTISSVKFIDPLKESIFTSAGFVGKLCSVGTDSRAIFAAIASGKYLDNSLESRRPQLVESVPLAAIRIAASQQTSLRSANCPQHLRKRSRMNRGKTFVGAILFVLLATFRVMAVADESADAAKTEPVDPSGSWKWEYNLNDNPAEFSLNLNWDGKQLTGKYTAFNNTTDIEEAKLADNKLSFIAKREFNGNKFTVHFDGQAEPDQIDGTVGVDFGEGPREFDWHAKRVVEVEDVLGVWKLRLETPQGVIEPQLTITKDGDKLHGDYVSPFGEREAKDLALKDGELSWTIASDDDDDFDFEIKYHGKPRGNKIAGSNEYDFGGQTGTMEFTGERTPPEEKQAAEPKPAEQQVSPPATTEAAPAQPAGH